MSGVFGGLAGVLSIFLNPFISGVFSGVAPLGVPLGENMRLTPRISGVFCWPSEVNGQVWPLTQFFSVSFLQKINGGQINGPSLRKQYSLPFLPATPSSPSRTLERLFELTRRPSRALELPSALLPELQRNKDTVRCAALGAEVPRHHQEQLN